MQWSLWFYCEIVWIIQQRVSIPVLEQVQVSLGNFILQCSMTVVATCNVLNTQWRGTVEQSKSVYA